MNLEIVNMSYILKSINVFIDKVEFVSCKPYWKMSGVL